MYDNINTFYRDTNEFINEITAPRIADALLNAEKTGEMNAEKYAYLSKAYVFMQDDEMALKYAKKSIEKDIGYVYGHIRVAFAYARMADKVSCRKYTEIADNLNADENEYITAFLAVLYNFIEETQKAEHLINVLTTNYRNSADYYYYIGFIYSQEEPDKALEYLEKAEAEGFRDKYNLWHNLAENYSLVDNYEKQEIYTDLCLKMGGTQRIFELKAECLKERGEFEESTVYLKKAYKLAKTKDDKLKILSVIIYNYTEANINQKASRLIRFAEKNFEGNHTFYYIAATFYENNEDYDKAIIYYKKMLQTQEGSTSSTYASLSFCYSQKGDQEKALECVNTALKETPDDSYAHYRKGRIYTKLKEYNKAIQSFEKSIDYDRTDVDSFQWISYCYSMLKDFEKSLEYANRAILLDKTDSYSYFRKAWAYQEMNRYTEAINFYNECIKLNDKYIDAYLNISYIYSKQGNTKMSLVYANRALLINQEYSYAYYRKAWALQESGRLEEAYDGYSKAIELDPSDIYNYLGIACIALNNQENQNALEYANKAIFIDKNCGGAYYYKSVALSNMGKQKEAEAAYSKAIQLGYSPI